MADTAKELKAKLLAREQKRLAAQQAAMERKVAILDNMPDAHCDQVTLITDVQSQGGLGSIHLQALGLDGLAAIMDAYTPVPMVHIKGGTFRTTCPADQAEREINKYGGEATEIAPFTFRINNAGRSYGGELECRWYCDLADGVRVSIQVKVFGGDDLPTHYHLGRLPDFAGYTVQYGTSYGERYVKNCNARLEVTPTPARIKWASGSRQNPNMFTYYWPNRPDLRVSDLVTGTLGAKGLA